MADQQVCIRLPHLKVSQLIFGLVCCALYVYYSKAVKRDLAVKSYEEYVEKDLFVIALLIGYPLIIFGFIIARIQNKKADYSESSKGLNSVAFLVDYVGFVMYILVGGFIANFFRNLQSIYTSAIVNGGMCIFTGFLFLLDILVNPNMQTCINRRCKCWCKPCARKEEEKEEEEDEESMGSGHQCPA